MWIEKGFLGTPHFLNYLVGKFKLALKKVVGKDNEGKRKWWTKKKKKNLLQKKKSWATKLAFFFVLALSPAPRHYQKIMWNCSSFFGVQSWPQFLFQVNLWLLILISRLCGNFIEISNLKETCEMNKWKFGIF